MEYELDESFKITDDKLADWAVRKIKEEEEERDRLVKIAENQINELTLKISQLVSQCENKTKFLSNCLYQYFDTVPHKSTKTQESYKLLSGSLVFKKPGFKITYNDEKLLAYLEANDGTDFIKTKKSVDWAEFKKGLTIVDGKVVDKDLGTVMESDVCGVEDTPASFTVKF